MNMELQADVALLRWQADLLRAEADTEMRCARFKFVRTLRHARANHPRIARVAWWYWRYWLQRGWDGRKVND